jgi:hypothetical protein
VSPARSAGCNEFPEAAFIWQSPRPINLFARNKFIGQINLKSLEILEKDNKK